MEADDPWGWRPLDDDPIPISALQHAVYCLRQAALIHIERLWEENRFTAEGRMVHVDRRRARPALFARRAPRHGDAAGLAPARHRRRRRSRRIPSRGGRRNAFPVEFKRGKPKLHRADEVQLCAQGLCLEEMTGRPVPEGALFYGETRRRVVVPFDAELRRLTEKTAAALTRALRLGPHAPGRIRADKCRACSLLDLCRPQAPAHARRSAWRERADCAHSRRRLRGAPP